MAQFLIRLILQNKTAFDLGPAASTITDQFESLNLLVIHLAGLQVGEATSGGYFTKFVAALDCEWNSEFLAFLNGKDASALLTDIKSKFELNLTTSVTASHEDVKGLQEKVCQA